MKAFNGTFEHNLDSKNRLFIPAEFKQILEGRITVRLSLSKYPHIDCYKEDDFENVVAYEIEHPERPYPKDILDSISRSYAKTVAVDNGGRICVPAKLLEKAGIKKESVFVGKGSFFQIWNPDIHERFNDDLMARIIADDEATEAENEKRNEYKRAGYFLEIKNTLGVQNEN